MKKLYIARFLWNEIQQIVIVKAESIHNVTAYLLKEFNNNISNLLIKEVEPIEL